MNLIEILHSRIDALPQGEHTIGVQSVLLHVEVAVRHFERGRDSKDDTAFTDAIYRTNQAYEGSLKEAYRVLAQKDPHSKTPNSIETYLQDGALLRPRVLTQLTNYRQEWRNPSTHDYRLDFNEDESLLAIFNVSAFAIVLIDQIAQKLAFEEAKAQTPPTAVQGADPPTLPLVDDLIGLLPQFLKIFNKADEETGITMGVGARHESQVVGALAGFLSVLRPNWKVETEDVFTETGMIADMLIVFGEEKLVVDIKKNELDTEVLQGRVVSSLLAQLMQGEVGDGLVIGVPSPNTGEIGPVLVYRFADAGTIKIVSAKKAG